MSRGVWAAIAMPCAIGFAIALAGCAERDDASGTSQAAIETTPMPVLDAGVGSPPATDGPAPPATDGPAPVDAPDDEYVWVQPSCQPTPADDDGSNDDGESCDGNGDEDRFCDIVPDPFLYCTVCSDGSSQCS